jgi:hypothetical protein
VAPIALGLILESWFGGSWSRVLRVMSREILGNRSFWYQNFNFILIRCIKINPYCMFLMLVSLVKWVMAICISESWPII